MSGNRPKSHHKKAYKAMLYELMAGSIARSDFGYPGLTGPERLAVRMQIAREFEAKAKRLLPPVPRLGDDQEDQPNGQ